MEDSFEVEVFLSSNLLDKKQALFKTTMKRNISEACAPPFDKNTLTKVWRKTTASWLL
jgi:hypothetical protein